MKRFLVFSGDYYYPSGGWDDFVNAFETLDEALKGVKDARGDWAHIIDTETMQEVACRG